MLCIHRRSTLQGAKNDRVLITGAYSVPRTVAVAFLCNYFLPHCDSRNDTESYFLTEEKKKWNETG